MFSRRFLFRFVVAIAAIAAISASAGARAEPVAADDFVRRIAAEVIDEVRADKGIQAGDLARIRALVDARVMPHVNFDRMTAMSVGPQWRGATPEQRRRMLEEFKTLLINTYSGALTQVKDQSMVVKPLRGGGGDGDVVVRSEVRGKGEPIQLDYRLEKAGANWRIYDVNVGGFWLVEAYKGQFARDLSAGGIDALINRLAEKNRSAAAPRS